MLSFDKDGLWTRFYITCYALSGCVPEAIHRDLWPSLVGGFKQRGKGTGREGDSVSAAPVASVCSNEMAAASVSLILCTELSWWGGGWAVSVS